MKSSKFYLDSFRKKHKKLTTLSYIIIGTIIIVLLASCLRFRENYYTRVIPERKGAEELLKTSVCADPETRVKINSYAKICIDAQNALSTSAIEKALIMTMYDMIPCQHESCNYIFGEITKWIILGLCAIVMVMFLYIKLRSTNQQYSQVQHLPIVVEKNRYKQNRLLGEIKED
jgi:uncharacterized membrane protein YuzA (DUF378 family)